MVQVFLALLIPIKRQSGCSKFIWNSRFDIEYFADLEQ
jgi:hypothetical protein